jgi:branched-chain amino acid transport system ATP-binding protein
VTTTLLDVKDLSMVFGGVVAIDKLSFSANQGQITAIIGPNGAGKTTLFNCLTGFYTPTTGELSLHRDGQVMRLDRMPGYRVAGKAGVVRTFQNIRLFPAMTVLENLLIAQHTRLMRASWYSIAGLFGLKSFRNAERAAIDKARYWLDRINLTHLADREAGTLPYGAQRRVEIARAMCADPILLCLDEPAAGLNPTESAELNQLLLSIRAEQGIAILLIEHDMSVVMTISDRIVVIDHGKGIAVGTPDEIKRNAAVIKAYLGEDDEAETETA